MELRTQLSSGALCAIRGESAEQSERSRQCVSSGELSRQLSPKERGREIL